MTALIVVAVIVMICAAILFFLVRSWLLGKHIVRQFQRCNVVVDGKKGKGKDVLFQYVIHKRKEPYYANIDYGGNYPYRKEGKCRRH